MKSRSRNIKLLQCLLFLIGTASLLFFYAINYQQFNSKPSNGPFLLQSIFERLSYPEIKHIARYLAFGPDISDIGPINTFPASIENAPKKLLQYIHWHAVQMECIRNELCYRKNKDKFQIMVWKCPKFMSYSCSGGGDRFRGMVSSLIIAMLAKQVFLLSWPEFPYPFITAVSPGAVDWRVPPHVELDLRKWGILKESKFPELVWQKCPPQFLCLNKNHSLAPVKPASINTINIIRSLRLNQDAAYDDLNRVRKLVIMTTGTYGDILCKSARWKETYGPYNRTIVKNLSFYVRRILFRVLLKPSPITQAVIQSSISSNARKEGYLSIHARTGIDVGENIARFRNFRRSQSQLMARNILQCVLENGPRPKYVFFSSDSVALKRKFREASSMYNIQVLYSELPALHMARYVRLPRIDTVATWFSFINIFVDFFALANGTDILSNYSQFSRQARIMSRTSVFRFFSDFLNKTICNEATNIGV